MMVRPAADAGEDVWEAYLHLRENPAGALEELWQHEAGCGAWLRVTRDTVSHQVLDVVLAAEVAS